MSLTRFSILSQFVGATSFETNNNEMIIIVLMIIIIIIIINSVMLKRIKTMTTMTPSNSRWFLNK